MSFRRIFDKLIKYRSIAKQVTAVVLSVFVLLGSVGVQASFHVCQDSIKTFQIFGESSACSDMEESISCSEKTIEDPHFDKKPCCIDKTLYSVLTVENSADNANRVDVPSTSIVNYTYCSAERGAFAELIREIRPPPEAASNHAYILYHSFLI